MSRAYEKNLKLDWRLSPADLHQQALAQLAASESIVRCVFGTDTSEVGLLDIALPTRTPFSFQKRAIENQAQFNVAYIVPTGVGAAQGGHAGDATPVLKAISSIADTVFTHPNVVNASDVNEMPNNTLYVEGSLLSAFLMGTIGLMRRRGNRVLALLGQHHRRYVEAAINTINAARATYGLDCLTLAIVPLTMKADWSPSGRASGEITGLDNVWQELNKHEGEFDTIAITSPITMNPEARDFYLEETKGESVNPWGGIEALLTHAIAMRMQVPVAHAPMMESLEVEALNYGIVDARVAAEMISLSYLQCVLKGLQRAPVVADPATPHSLTAADVNALIIPRGCFGMPIYAALHQGIRVIAVADKIYAEDHTEVIRALPWRPGQYREVSNYSEALGILACMKAGIVPEAISRPLQTISL
ncbi:MAG: DUF3326 domain-containing protein [Candidatus Andersenbacteria bacterium]